MMHDIFMSYSLDLCEDLEESRSFLAFRHGADDVNSHIVQLLVPQCGGKVASTDCACWPANRTHTPHIREETDRQHIRAAIYHQTLNTWKPLVTTMYQEAYKQYSMSPMLSVYASASCSSRARKRAAREALSVIHAYHC